MSTVYIRFEARGSPPLQRSPLVERLIARASTSSGVANWRAEAFALAAPRATIMPPIAVMALRGSGGVAAAAAGEWVCVATPVHLSAGMTHVTFPLDGILQLDQSDASALAADFNRALGGAGVRLVVGCAGSLLCHFDRAISVLTHDPEAAVGQDVFGFQPSGQDAQRLRRLMSEIEMWLFNHAVNQHRTERGQLPITGLWLWGGGAPDAPLPALPMWAAGQDVFFGVLGDASRGSGSGVVAVNDYPGSPTWSEVERQWLRPAVADLTAGRIGQMHISAARRRFTVVPGFNRRFWRLARPWWESFE